MGTNPQQTNPISALLVASTTMHNNNNNRDQNVFANNSNESGDYQVVSELCE